MSQPPYAADLGLQLCHDCGQVCRLSDRDCPRCDAVLHRRKRTASPAPGRCWSLR